MKSTDNKSKLVRKYHAICEVSHTTEAMQIRIKDSYGVKHISDLSEEKIEKVIGEIERIPNMWRKRVMASIGGWLYVTSRTQSAIIIKGIACRATGHDDFNKIPVSRLRDLYSEFLHKQEIAAKADIIKDLVVAEIASKN